MSTAPEHSAARQRLLSLAAGAVPPKLAPTDAWRMVRQARMAAAGRRKAASERATFRLALGGLAAAGLVAAFLRLAPEDAGTGQGEIAAPRATALRMQLPSRDTLVATPGARFELANADPGERRIELRDGAIAFDVVPLDPGQRFVVVTPHLSVRVRGTVFSVAVDAQRTEVRVYEGVVVVGAAGAERTLRAGESYASDGSAVTRDEAAPLQREASELAAHHARLSARPAAAAAPPAEPEAALGGAAPRAEAVRTRDGASQAYVGASLEQARAWLHAGQAARALAAGRRASASANTSETRGDWLLLQADALRSLGRVREAAQAYRTASLLLPDEPRVQAGFKAAEAFLRELDDRRAALAVLDTAAVDAPSSALRERGLLLRIAALERAGEPIAEVARRYLVEYPDSAGAPRLRALLERGWFGDRR